jgi:hypothetical protein
MANGVAGLPDRYLGKLLAPKPVRRIGMISLAPVLAVLGAELWLVGNPEAVRRFGSRLKKRNDNLVRGGTTVIELSHRFMRKIQAKGRKARFAKMTAEQRSELARELNRIRWSKPKVTETKRNKARAA